ncbi:MAG: hypothetical protein EPN82_03445 [Bacteroidetes bacterium]|nr:MAG: hypothetical protein EPN82_03445 [Bacteroidota bacterium]
MKILKNKFIIPEITFLLITFFCNNNFALFAQTNPEDIIILNKLKKLNLPEDSLQIYFEKVKQGKFNPDSVKVESIDTIPPNVPLISHGRAFVINNEIYKSIRKENIRFHNYNTLFDILQFNLPAFPLSLDGIGTYRHLSLFGSSPKDISFQFNNRPYKDLEYGSLNIEQLTPEFMEQAEVLVGSDAVIISDNSSGASINLQEIRYNTKKPYTRLWYSQAGYDFISADGIYSQNFIKNWNFTFGFRTMTATGRYANSWLQDWNVRTLLRWNPSDYTSISFVENYTNHGYGTNGGVDVIYSSDIYDNVYARVKFENLNERVFRHDLTLTYTSLLDKDSSSTLSGSIYFSNSEWDNYRSKDLFVNLTDTVNIINHTSHYMGATAKYEQDFFRTFQLRVGGDVEYDVLPQTYYFDELNDISLSAFAHGLFEPVKNIKISGGLRFTTFAGKTALSTGAKAVLSLANELELIGDLSIASRFPTPSEGLNLSNEKHFLGLAELRYKTQPINISIGAFYRNVDNPILTYAETIDSHTVYKSYSENKRTVLGLYANLGFIIFGNINISIWGQGYLSRTNDSNDYRFPDFIAGIRGYYEIIAGKSVLRLGTSFGFIGEMKGEQYVSIGRKYLPNSTTSLAKPLSLDLFAEARLGVAYLKLTYENILSQGYYYVPYYPQLDGNFRISVGWPFLD